MLFRSPEATNFPSSIAAGTAGSSPLRQPLRRREGRGTPDLWSAAVDSRVVCPAGALVKGRGAPRWNKVAGARSPSRRGLWRSWRAAGVCSSRILRSAEVRCSWRGRRSEAAVLRAELLSSAPLFAAARWVLALLWRCWRWSGQAMVLVTGFATSLYRRWRRCRAAAVAVCGLQVRSEERRVGKECLL